MLDKALALAPELIRLRRDIHQHPELSFQEFRTSALVADMLREIGVRTTTNVGRTGVIGEIGSGTGPTIAIRADMDALPIHEKNRQAPYCSENDGVMHACGHDAHTAILLGAANLLQQSFRQEKWQGNVRLLFQPSEEAFDAQGVSGATAMISDKALEGVDAVIALHVFSTVPSGLAVFQDGYSMAAVDSFEGWIRGDGGHGAYPHTGSDPIFMLGQVLNNLYSIPSRWIDPLKPSVVSVGEVRGGSAPNVIPNEVYIQGTIRSFEEPVRQKLAAEVERAFKVTELLNGRYDLTIHRGYPALYNAPQVNSWLREVAREVVGEAAMHEAHFGMGGEDFAYMAQQCPGAMFILGAAQPDGIARPHHTDGFDIDENVMPKGTAVLAETARRFVLGQLS